MHEDEAPPMKGVPALSLTLSVSMKVGLPNYSAADAFFSIRGVTMETTPEEMDELIDGPGKIAYEKLAAKLRERVLRIKQSASMEAPNF